jgi:hypothetical protein
MRYKLLQFWPLATRIWIKQPMLKILRLNLLPDYVLVLQTTLTRAPLPSQSKQTLPSSVSNFEKVQYFKLWAFKRDASPRLEHQDIPPISNLGTSKWGDVTTKSHDTYIAGPIRHNEVRLMVLKPGVSDDHIFVSMITVDDADLESEKVPYIALSYSCRNEQCDSVIFVQEDPESPPLKTIKNGIATPEAKTFKVTPNVWQALRHLRRPR